MKRALIIIVTLIGNFASMIAQSVNYAYDSSGNRIKREIVVSRDVAEFNAGINSFCDLIADKEIEIHPNPTDGVLRIRIKNFDSSDKTEFMIFDLSGMLLLKRLAETYETALDITTYPSAIYILIININGEKTSWRIIKK